ncbi:ABC transporter G family member 23 [Folsomia candida]|uniref:ABC transporter G family member 23 n=1 Tax=Folsomia candida TaxID=158441 RepID=A0A226F415_FOLCA|nr:ABC transporter G family member 23 [Folsomia candida]
MAVRVQNGYKKYGNFETLHLQRVAYQFECIFDAKSNAVNGFDLRGPRDLPVTVGGKYGLFVMSHINSNVFLTLNPTPLMVLTSEARVTFPKTTLISCIVGLRQLDMGEVTLFGQPRPDNLGRMCGYMPQANYFILSEIALLNVLTIRETLEYFGMLYAMDEFEIEKRINFLTTFLDLRKINHPIHSLSGGQKRRVSLAVAMIHNPKILVLEIWGYLVDLSRNYGATILMSTHYLEETKSCDKVGFMRGGRLLEEDSPKSLLCKYEVATMEGAVLHLCRKDDNNTDEDPISFAFESVKLTKYISNSMSTKVIRNDGESISLPRVKSNHAKIIHALNLKWWNRCRRDWRLLIGMLIVPIFCVLTFENIVGPEPHGVRFGIVHNNPDFNISVPNHCNYDTYNKSQCLGNVGICNFLDKFETDKFNWVHVNSYEDGMDLVEAGSVMGIIEFPLDFSVHMKNRMLLRNFADNETIHGSTVSIKMDETNNILSSWARKIIVDKYLLYIDAIATACSFNGSIQPPLQFSAIYGSIGLFDVVSFIEPGAIIINMFSLPMSLVIIWTEDRVAGLEGRDFVAGVHLWHRFVSNILTQSVMIFLQIGTFLALMCHFYGMVIHGSLALAVGLVYSSAITGLMIGFMVGALWDSVLDVVFLIIFICIGQIFTTGVMWPLEMAPWFARKLFECFPVTHAIEALRAICIRGWSLTNPVVAMGFLPAVGWITIALLVSILAERKRYN